MLKLRRRKGKNRTIFSLIFTLILCMGIGYAYIQSQISLGGTATANKQVWKIEEKNLTMDLDSTATSSSIKFVNTNKIIEAHFTATLSSIDDYYSFYFDIENNGTIDSKVKSLTLQGLSATEAEYLDYTMTYYNGDVISLNDKLPANEMETIVILVKYKDGSEVTSGTYKLSFKLEYAETTGTTNNRGTTITKMLKSNAVLDNIQSTYVSNLNGIDFSTPSSDTNGKGIYMLNNTTNDNYPIYYYRGDISNNFVKFNNICWRIIRTTSTGGIKLIYSGIYQNNLCSLNGNVGIVTTESKDSLTYAGYMYGKVYSQQSQNYNTTYLYGSNVNFENNQYTLQNTTNDTSISSFSTHHYTCFNDTGICNDVSYIYATDNGIAYYVNLDGATDIDEVISNMKQNTNNSVYKTKVDTWYENNMNNVTSKLEDTIYCNDRKENTLVKETNNGWLPNGGNTNTVFWTNVFGRTRFAYTPSLNCEDNNDAFSVSDKIGNGALKYPVALVTADEVSLAGAAGYVSVTYYLNDNHAVDNWTMSPAGFHFDRELLYLAISDKGLCYKEINLNGNIRPVISLKRGTKFVSGTGTSSDPYIVN